MAQVVVGLDVIWRQRERVLKMRSGFVQLALLREDDAQVVVCVGDVGANRQNLAPSRGRRGQPSGAMFALCQGQQSVERGWLSGSLAGRRHRAFVLVRCRPSRPYA
jgi:hypothetical protein